MADDSANPQPKRRLSIHGAIAIIGGASYFSLTLGLLRGILYTRLLPSPESRGVVGIVFLAITYLTHTHLGIIDGITKRVPALLGQGREDEAERLERAGITAVFFLSMLGASLMWIYAVLSTGSDIETRYAIGIGGGYLVLMQMSSVFRLVLRARQHFRLMARSTVLEALLLLALVVAGSATLDAPGTMLGWALGLGIVCLYLLSHDMLPAAPLFDVRGAVELAKSGMPILGVNIFGRFARTIDKVAIAYVFGKGTFAFYDVAWQLSSYLYNVAGAASEVVTPKVLQAHGEGNSQAIGEAVLKGTKALALLMPALAGFTAIIGPLALRVVLPRYVEAIPPVQVLLMAVVLLAIPTALRATLIARNREAQMMACDAIAGLIGGAAVWILATRNAPMHHLALGAGVGWMVSGGLTTWRGLIALDLPPRRVALTMAWLGVPFVYASAVLWVLKTAIPSLAPAASPIAADAIAAPIFLALSLPLAWLAERQTGIISRIARRRKDRKDRSENQ